MERSLWGHLPLLMRSNSMESVEYILQALWRTRKTGLDAADRLVIREMLQLQDDSDLDPVIPLYLTQYTHIIYKHTVDFEIRRFLFLFFLGVGLKILGLIRFFCLDVLRFVSGMVSLIFVNFLCRSFWCAFGC